VTPPADPPPNLGSVVAQVERIAWALVDSQKHDPVLRDAAENLSAIRRQLQPPGNEEDVEDDVRQRRRDVGIKR
jgi:hypothetical protein